MLYHSFNHKLMGKTHFPGNIFLGEKCPVFSFSLEQFKINRMNAHFYQIFHF